LKSTDKITYSKKLLDEFFLWLGNFEDCIGHTEAIDENTYSNLEKLDKLYENFYNFKNESSNEDHNTCGKGEICAQDYMNQESTCKGKGNNRFCKELEKFRELFNNHLESIKKCDNIGELPYFQGSSLAGTISIPVSAMSLISLFSFVTYKVGNFFVISDNLFYNLWYTYNKNIDML
ncbi:hypothetical protein PCYB_007310, partial [Plasmodium cynomolgi strain B]